MPLYETESLVLKSYNLAEADRIVVFFTREHGLVRGVAKGAKRLKSKFGSTLELFSTVQLSYFQKEDRELVSIQNVELIRSCFAEASEPAFLQTFSYIADLLMAFQPPHDPNETLYRMTKACLETASNSIDSLKSVQLYFELWVLRLGGYLPDWGKCDDCGRAFAADDTAGLQYSFHLLCATCQKSRSINTVSAAEREVFHNVQKLGPEDFADYASEKSQAVDAVSGILKRIISTVIGRDVNSGTPAAMSQYTGQNAA
jgi:DNA repair protein RecO (recombination protein O)